MQCWGHNRLRQLVAATKSALLHFTWSPDKSPFYPSSDIDQWSIGSHRLLSAHHWQWAGSLCHFSQPSWEAFRLPADPTEAAAPCPSAAAEVDCDLDHSCLYSSPASCCLCCWHPATRTYRCHHHPSISTTTAKG